MKRILSFAALAAALVFSVSCEKDGKGEGGGQTTLEFEKALYTVYEKGTAEITVEAGKEVKSEVVVPLTFTGTAERGVDFEIEEAVTIAAGSWTGSVTLKDISLSAEKTLTIGIKAPKGYKLGTKRTATVTPADQEAIILNFDCAENVLHEEYIATISAVGAVSGNDWRAETDIEIPLKRSGEGGFNNTFATPVIKAGEYKTTVTINLYPYDFHGDSPAVFEPDIERNPRLVAGDKGKLTLHVRGALLMDDLVGTWKFVKVFDQEELESWYEECEDDATLLPVHNDGFTLTVSKDGDDYKVTPAGSGDFNWYFRSCTLFPAWPKNLCPNGIGLKGWDGKSSSTMAQEINGFVAEDPDGISQLVSGYFELSSANWAFRDDKEDLQKAVIALAILPNGKLVVSLRDYDITAPKFGEGLFMMWDYEWDAELMGFSSLFEKN